MEYKMVIHNLDVEVNKDGLENVILNVHWGYQLTDGEHIVSNIGVESLDAPNPEKFTSWEDLDANPQREEIVLGWVKAKWGEEKVAKIEEQLAKQLELKKNPPIISKRFTSFEVTTTEKIE